MITPIFDFVKKYSDSKMSRFHMPGHKGTGQLGCEKLDITEIKGADVLYSADGIIEESENNLTSLYGTCHSFYSTEGSTLAIKAMLRLVSEGNNAHRPLILAARNVHTAFIKAAALLDLDVEWIYSESQSHLCSCYISADDVRVSLDGLEQKPCAVYLTSPDYLGNMLDIAGIAKICREREIPLVVDNAHGAYLKFLPEDLHPISFGAAICADSAHKTLPVLTGGAYLHISKDYPDFVDRARDALSLFASTSPSYLTLCSLDLCNKRLDEDYPERLKILVSKISEIKEKISDLGYTICDSEPLKITVKSQFDLAHQLRKYGIEPEFSDKDYTVLMLTPENTDEDFDRLIRAFSEIKPANVVEENDIAPRPHNEKISIRTAVFSKNEPVNAENSLGRICAMPTVSCPPAVPIVISGERITENDVKLFKHYGIDSINVVVE